MERRQFLGMVVAGVGSAALGGSAVGALASDPKPEVKDAPPVAASKREAELSPEAALVAYCGRSCAKCAMSAFNVGLSAAALQKVNDTISISKSAGDDRFSADPRYGVHCCAEFDRDVTSFAGLAKMAFPPGCRKGCVPCDIPDCCKAKGYLTCAECDQTAKCEKLGRLTKYRKNIDANQQGIREHGLEKWAKMQCDEAISEKKAALHKAIDEAFWRLRPLIGVSLEPKL